MEQHTTVHRVSNAIVANVSDPRVVAGRAVPPTRAAYLAEIWAPRGREMIRLGVETLNLLEAERDYVRLHARGRTYLVRATLQDLERRLDPTQFIRVHRSTIVARDQISGLRRSENGGWIVLLSTGSSVRVGRSLRPTMRKVVKGSA